MAQVPDKLVNKGRQFTQRALLVVGGLFGLSALGNCSGGATGSGILAGLIAGLAVCIAAGIKTTYRLKGGVAVYD